VKSARSNSSRIRAKFFLGASNAKRTRADSFTLCLEHFWINGVPQGDSSNGIWCLRFNLTGIPLNQQNLITEWFCPHVLSPCLSTFCTFLVIYSQWIEHRHVNPNFGLEHRSSFCDRSLRQHKRAQVPCPNWCITHVYGYVEGLGWMKFMWNRQFHSFRHILFFFLSFSPANRLILVCGAVPMGPCGQCPRWQIFIQWPLPRAEQNHGDSQLQQRGFTVVWLDYYMERTMHSRIDNIYDKTWKGKKNKLNTTQYNVT